MELFFASDIVGDRCRMDAEESAHCIKVLRHRCGDEIHLIDGEGTLLRCRLTEDDPRGAGAVILERTPDWGAHPYRLTLAVCPTKNNDRFEWFVEKATEVGVDRIVPVIGDRSERKVYKTERALRIARAATKQSLKARVPEIGEPVSVRDFIAGKAEGTLPLIAYCFDGPCGRTSIRKALAGYPGRDITVLIGPEGDFSPEEAGLALAAGYLPIHLGASRLRTETAALTAAEAVYLHFME